VEIHGLVGFGSEVVLTDPARRNKTSESGSDRLAKSGGCVAFPANDFATPYPWINAKRGIVTRLDAPLGSAFETARNICCKFLELGRTVCFPFVAIAGHCRIRHHAAGMPCSLSAQTPDHPTDNSAQFPPNRDLKSLTCRAAIWPPRHAAWKRDANSAAGSIGSALRTDPKNNELLDRAFISSLGGWRFDGRSSLPIGFDD